MPRVTLTFTLPDEEPDMRAALAAREALAVLHEIDRRMRELQKYSQMAYGVEAIVKEIRDMIPQELLDI